MNIVQGGWVCEKQLVLTRDLKLWSFAKWRMVKMPFVNAWKAKPLRTPGDHVINEWRRNSSLQAVTVPCVLSKPCQNDFQKGYRTFLRRALAAAICRSLLLDFLPTCWPCCNRFTSGISSSLSLSFSSSLSVPRKNWTPPNATRGVLVSTSRKKGEIHPNRRLLSSTRHF